MGIFKLCAPYRPAGDQPKAIEALSHGINSGQRHQTLLGVTGSGKTFTMANVIAETSRPTLVIAHNKTLAAQLCGEFKEFFPENAVEFFVSYYDYYQPEAYLPVSDTYIAKDASINDEIEKLRHSATAALLERRDVIIVASVSAIYGLGDPADYLDLTLSCSVGASLSREEILRRLVGMQYKRNEVDFSRGTFRSKGEVVDIFPAGYSDKAVRIQLFGDEVEKICEIDVLTGEVLGSTNHAMVFPASHYATGEEKMKLAAVAIREELDDRLAYLRGAGKLLEAQRLEQRTHFDLEMMEEMGYCSGIENYSRHLAGREAGSPPYTLLDYFPEDYIIMIDESHATLPQIGAMYEGDRSRKASLVEYGFRLPSAIDNRPLTFAEFESRARQLIYISATPADYERRHSGTPVEQVVRPTGLIDPAIEIRPVKGQIDDLLEQIRLDTDKGGRVLVTTLTKRMAEDLTEFLKAAGVRVRYLHSDINTLERMSIVRELRLGNFDVLAGINLLREGLDLPEVTLVAILDADKEGFLRSERSLIQTIGRAARNIEGRVVLYADRITDSMRSAIGETERRREIQQEFNRINGIVPRSVKKDVRDVIASIIPEGGAEIKPPRDMTRREREKFIASLEKQMRQASQKLEFEQAAELRDLIIELKAGV